MKLRNEISEEFKWNSSKFCKSNEEWFEKLEDLKTKISEYKKYKGTFNNPNKLLKFFEFDSNVEKLFERLSMFLSCNLSVDADSREYNEMSATFDYVINDWSRETTFVTVELNNLKSDYLKKLIKDEKFKNYDLILKNILKNKKRKLTKKEEELLSKITFSSAGYEIFHAFDDLNVKFDKVKVGNKSEELTNSNYSGFMENPNRKVRKQAFCNMHKAFKDMCATLSTNYIYFLKENWFYAEIRKYKSCLDESLQDDDVKKELYNKLIYHTRKNVNLLQKGFRLIKKALKVKNLEYYDLFANITNNITKKVDYDYAIETIKNATSVLGEEYTKLIETAKKDRWIDVYPNKGKESGAYSSSIYEETPVVLVNFENILEDVFTLGHELGHAMHSYYSNKYNVYEKAGYSIFNAEVASTVNEILILKYYYNNAKTKEEKLYFLKKYFSMFKSTWFRQTMFSEFEQFAHNLIETKQPISKEILCERYANLNKFYHGNAVKHNDLISYEWLRIPHFYRPFYVYKYSIGIISAVCFTNKILSGDKLQVENYINYLKSGGSDYPSEILKKCGVNLETNEPYIIAAKELKWLISEMQKYI